MRGGANVTDKNIGVIRDGVIVARAFLDLNYNGRYDEGEPGYEGVTVEAVRVRNSESFGRLTTGADGTASFTGLRNGEYRLRALLPNDGSIFTITLDGNAHLVNRFEQRQGRREYTLEDIVVTSGGEETVLIGVALAASVSGTVFEDANYDGVYSQNESPLSGVRVELLDAQGQTLASDTTDRSGAYLLEDVMPGDYTLRFVRRDGYGFTRVRADVAGGNDVVALEGAYGVTGALTVLMAQDVSEINAGMLPAATVSGVLFQDLNDDGLRGEDEWGMTSATVRLLSDDGEIDLLSAVGADGSYFFDGVMPGAYTLVYQLAGHCEMARTAVGGNTATNETVRLSVLMGEAYEAPLAGAVTLGTFEGYVFADANANGVCDEGEARMAGATVTLTPDNNASLAQTVQTGADGTFSILSLRPASYRLTVELPDGYIFSRALEADGLSFGVMGRQVLTCPWAALINRTQKAIGAVIPASIEGVVWLDEDQNGQRGAGEAVLSGLSVDLIDESMRSTVKRVTTTESGFAFTNVRPGTYTVRFTLPDGSSPAVDIASTFTKSGSYMAQAGISVAQGDALTGLTTGLVSLTRIGGTFCLDEGGEQSPVSGVAVLLFAGEQNNPLQRTVTGEDGSYLFDGLWPGDYVIQASLPEGMVFIRQDDPAYEAGTSVITATGNGVGTSDSFYLHMAQHQLSENILCIRPGKVGDSAWLDENQNGLVDGDEPGLPGVTVRLLQNGIVAYETVTDAWGYYLFDDVYPGEYTLEAVAYSQLAITTPVDALRIISSCLVSGDGEGAQSAAFTLESGGSRTDFDLGYVLRDGETIDLEDPPTKDWTNAFLGGYL